MSSIAVKGAEKINSLVWFMFLRLTMLGLINVEIALRIGFTELNSVNTSVNTATSS